MATEQSPRSIEFIWKSPDGAGPFRLRLWYGYVDGRPAVVGVEMWGVEPVLRPWVERHLAPELAPDIPGLGPAAFGPPAPPLPEAQIKATDIRLPLGSMLDAWVALPGHPGRAALAPEVLAKAAEASKMLGLLSTYMEGTLPEFREEARDYLQHFDDRPRGRPAVSDQLLQVVADQYQKAVEAGDRAPAQAVERYLGLLGHKKLNAATVRRWVGLARKRDYLPPSRRRKS